MKPKSVIMRFYEVFPALTALCNESGYALAVHGSLGRDIDLIAVPWSDGAISADDLVGKILAANGLGSQAYPWQLREGPGDSSPVDRPHGRRAWSIYIAPTTYIDLSVMPRKEVPVDSIP